MYSSWDIRHNKQSFLSFWVIFLPFYLLTTWKIKISKKWKKHLGISSFYTSVPKTMIHMLYCSWDMAHDRWNYYFSFLAIFCPFTPNSPKNHNFKKMERAPGDIIILYMCTKNYDWMMCSSWDMVCDRQTDGRTDRWKKWNIEVGAPPKNSRHKL